MTPYSNIYEYHSSKEKRLCENHYYITTIHTV